VGRKLKIILSDLHLGAGYAFEGGNCLEDFTADEQLIRFLCEIGLECERDQREVELIINGDFFEFLQIPAVDDYDPHQIYPKEVYFDSSEEASVKRLNIIYQGHPTIFNALSDFLHVAPQRRITIIKGNHDVNLFWPGVKSRLRDILGTSGSRASLLLFAEEFVSREKIYVEHGHQRAEKMNSYHDFLDPRLPNDPSQLYYPTGSHFVINVFNEVERERWFVDSIKPLTALIWYALKWDFNFAAKILASFISHTPALVISDFAPGHDGAFSNNTLLEYLKDDAKRNQMAKRYQEDITFRQQFHQQIQRYLDDAHVANKSEINFQITDINGDPLAMGQAEQQRQQNALRYAAEQTAKQEGAQVVVFGHTHHPVHEQLECGSIYINTGCWLWKQDLSNASMETWEALFKGTKKHVDIPGHLPYARIDYDEHNNPTAQLLNFTGKETTVNVKADQPSGLFTKVLSRLVAPLRGVS
jgi:UDP-2,3-diacylglucosamine pyrophosphatase LpxH